ncbi:FAD-dependent oxidoreductase [Acuticoccus sp. MNP-M23]|uniref:FAD-dependent oxidoreductase n=1 Tax=Acuticoccus sp. MNP-M23 TaxID=3072793 RepID=UPI0028161B20|nr:FAD-dependent oxidoreductase [Acuticoccus sp. MNP-M23]WMS42179.1 FAD-dependent oxidoreductase [Acuticoccus sp. MNP-M23]
MKRVIFAGAGHATLIALDRLARMKHGAKIILVSDGPSTHYSGMVPGWIEGIYAGGAMSIPLASFCDARGIRLVDARIEGADDGCLSTTAGKLPFDHLVLNLGAVAWRDAALANSHVVPAKPFDSLIAGLQTRANASAFAIVGAGPAGLETAFALRARHPATGVTVIERGNEILSAFARRFAKRVADRLAAADISVLTGAEVAGVDAETVELADGRRIFSGCTLAFTGAAPPPVLASMPFARAADGFVAVDGHMRSLSHPNVLAVGDVATAEADPRPKAGVFSVRSGKPLADAVAALADGRTPPPLVLQRRGLVLLSTGGRRAIGVRNGLVAEGRWVWRLKDHFDRSFVDRFAGPPRR